MKSKILFICIAFLSTITIAQSKVGTVDSDYIINLMPEAKVVVDMTQKYGAKLDTSFSIKIKEFQNKVDAFKKEETTLGTLAKKTAVKEITDLENDIKKYQANGQKLMQLKQDELMRPLYKKLSDAIKEVAKSNGFTQILTITGNEFAYIDENLDITKLVIKKLGITVPEPKK
ncbi:OmpH family outer membrane protein [Polaribacter pectinis]|uniref:OmpH family outer membrane protein n=1 Tax=Polaribacter pectinis TaxID=2738844 RepID=A0A7G9LC59_9FLAO|nr:OmpH family outer membrane protein [Polaribacter pectinis]QNM86208.1 OmpH family outer membrane protein [Polaribacter pectinis]